MSESDEQVPVQSLEKTKKAVKGKTVVWGGSNSAENSNKRYIESLSESDAEGPLQKIENSTIALMRKRKDIGKLSNRVKGKNVVQKESKSIMRLNKRFQVSESESDAEAPVNFIGFSTRTNKSFQESQGESDWEANNVSNLKKAVKGKCLGRDEAKTVWKLNNLFMESQSESDGEAPELNGNSTEPVNLKVMVRGENKTIKKSKKQFLESHSEGDEEHPVQNLRKSGKPAKRKRVLMNRKSDKWCPENKSEAREDNQQMLRSLKRLKKIGDVEVKRPLGCSRSQHVFQNQRAIDKEPLEHVEKSNKVALKDNLSQYRTNGFLKKLNINESTFNNQGNDSGDDSTNSCPLVPSKISTSVCID